MKCVICNGSFMPDGIFYIIDVPCCQICYQKVRKKLSDMVVDNHYNGGVFD